MSERQRVSLYWIRAETHKALGNPNRAERAVSIQMRPGEYCTNEAKQKLLHGRGNELKEHPFLLTTQNGFVSTEKKFLLYSLQNYLLFFLKLCFVRIREYVGILRKMPMIFFFSCCMSVPGEDTVN